MDFTVQTVCVFEPLYLRLLTLGVAAAGIAAICSVAIALRRILATNVRGSSGHPVFHLTILAVVMLHVVAAAFYFAGHLQQVSEYQQTHGAAPALRSAVLHEAGVHALAALAVLVLMGVSYAAWRQAARPLVAHPTS